MRRGYRHPKEKGAGFRGWLLPIGMLLAGIGFLVGDLLTKPTTGTRLGFLAGEIPEVDVSGAAVEAEPMAETPESVEPQPAVPLEPVEAWVPPEAQEIRVVDWNIRWFPSGYPEPRSKAVETANIRTAAAVIRALEPHIFCAEEIRSAEVAQQLADEIALLQFDLAVCSAYTNYDGTAGMQQTAIYSSYTVLTNKWDSWHTVGYIDPPRGYAFALLDAPGGPVGVFSVHLKSNYISPEAENPRKLGYINRLKRQFASDQLRSLVKEWKDTGFVPENTRFLVAGDFNTEESKKWKGETTLSAFRKEGWRSCYEGQKPEACYTVAAEPEYGYDAVTFDYIFSLGFAGQKNLKLHPVDGRISDHAIVEITLY